MLLPVEANAEKVEVFGAVAEEVEELVESVDGGEGEFDEVGVLWG